MKKMVVISQTEYDTLCKKAKFLDESYNVSSSSKKFLNAHKLNEESRRKIQEQQPLKEEEKKRRREEKEEEETSFNTTSGTFNSSVREDPEEAAEERRRKEEEEEEEEEEERKREEERRREEEEEERKKEEEAKKKERKGRKEGKKQKEREERENNDSDVGILVEKFGKYYPNKLGKGTALINAIINSKNVLIKIADQEIQLNEINVDFETFLTFIDLCTSRKKVFTINVDAFVSFLASNDIPITLISNPIIRSKIEDALFQPPAYRSRSRSPPERSPHLKSFPPKEKPKEKPITWFLDLNSVPDTS